MKKFDKHNLVSFLFSHFVSFESEICRENLSQWKRWKEKKKLLRFYCPNQARLKFCPRIFGFEIENYTSQASLIYFPVNKFKAVKKEFINF
jgi:hypothetical protein